MREKSASGYQTKQCHLFSSRLDWLLRVDLRLHWEVNRPQVIFPCKRCTTAIFLRQKVGLQFGIELAGRKHSCVKYHSTYEITVMGRRSSSRVPAETMETRGRVDELQEVARKLAGRDHSRKQREEMDERDPLLAS